MKFNLKILFILVMLLLSLSFVAATPLDSLNEFYQASVDEDLEAYIAIQDHLFLAEQEINPTTYFQSFFDEMNTLSYDIINPEVFEEENTALVFYELKGEIESEDGIANIDNDMVAFLWKYDDWKVRWTITRTLYEEKIAFNLVMDAAIELTLDEASGQTLKQELIAGGFDINIVDEENLSSDKSFEFPWLLIIFILLAVLVFLFRKKIMFNLIKLKDSKKYKTTFKKVKKYSKTNFEKVKRYSEKTYEKAKPQIKKSIKDVKNYSKKSYKVAKPRFKKGLENAKSYSKNVVDKTTPLLKKLKKQTKKLTKKTKIRAKKVYANLNNKKKK